MTNVSRETKNLITREDCALIVIDAQEKLLPAISNKEKVIENMVRLVKFSKIIGVPVVLTEQEKLGQTISEVKKELVDVQPISKVHFNCFFCDDFSARIEALNKKTLVLAGAEAHICIAQTALYAVPRFAVHVISDAVSSRTQENVHVSLERMRQAGVVVSSTEMFIYELLQRAGTDEFKAVLQLVK